MSRDIDFSLPVANVLSQGTALAHEKAQHSPSASALAKGELGKDEYIRLLMMLWHLYQ